MEILYPRCAGLDVHKDMVMARVRCVSEPAVDETRSFATTTGALIELQEWLSSHAVTHVAMEATGVYWKPVWHLLEEHFELVLTDAQHIKNVPGRKTDVNDAAWIADLLAHGLILAPITSLAATAPRRSGACSDDWMTSAARSNSPLRLPERSVVRICTKQQLLSSSPFRCA
jgi:transposase